MYLDVLLLVVIVGVILYLIETYIPMAPGFKVVVRVIAILSLIGYLLRAFGLPRP